jgi:hypothetical protein
MLKYNKELRKNTIYKSKRNLFTQIYILFYKEQK